MSVSAMSRQAMNTYRHTTWYHTGLLLILLNILFAVQSEGQCKMSNGMTRPSFYNIVVLMDNTFVNNFGSGQAAKDYAVPRVNAAVAALNYLFNPPPPNYELNFQVVFFPKNVIIPNYNTLPSVWGEQIKNSFESQYPCIKADCILVLTQAFSSGGGHGNNGVAMVSDLGVATWRVAHEIGHNLGFKHPTPACSATCNPLTFMCSGSTIKFNDCDNVLLATYTQDGIFSQIACQGCHCDTWADISPVYPEGFNCSTQAASVSASTNQPYLTTACIPDRSVSMLTVTVNGGPNGVSGGILKIGYPNTIYDWASTTGLDFNSTNVPTNPLVDPDNQLTLGPNGTNPPINLAPNESKTFHTVLTYNPDNGDPATSPPLEITVRFSYDNTTKTAFIRPKRFANLSGAGQTFPATEPARITGDVTLAGITPVLTPLILVDPGVKIIIPNTATLSTDLYHPVKIEGCESMWKGIQVSTGGTLDLNNTTISDAQFAINANKGSKVIVKNTMFLNNDYGIYTNSTGSGGYDLTLLSNQFMTTSTGLKPTYTGQTPVPSIKGYVGVYLNNATAGVNIDSDPGSSSSNLFSNLKFGVLSYNSALNIKNTAFEHIETVSKGTGYDAQPPVTGHAVYASGGTLNLQGGINSSSPPVSFKNCLNGVTGSATDLSVQGCKMDEVENGIVFVGEAANTFKATWNEISSKNSGIFAAMPNNIQPALIENNTVNLMPGAYYYGIGISAYGATGSGAAQYKLNTNTVYLKNGTTGIHLGSVSNTTASGNTVNLLSEADQYGIRTDGGEKITVNCNNINGDNAPSNSALSRGIYAIHASKSDFICNTTDKTADGLHFEGVLVGKEKAGVAGNTMSNNATGLLLGAGAVIGKQTNQGNLWTAGGGGVTVARHLTPSAAPQSLFTVDAGENPDFIPTIVNPNNFFIDVSDPFQSFICALANCALPDPGGDLGLYKEIAKGQLTGSAYTDVNNWLAQRRLYERIIKDGNPAAGDADIANFITNAQNSDMSGYAAVQVGLRNNFGVSAPSADTLSRQINEVFVLLNNLGNLEQQIAAETDSVQKVNLAGQRQAVLGLISNIHNSKDGIRSTIKSNHDAVAAVLLQQNNSLSPTNVFQQNEQRVNRLLLTYIAGEYAPLDSVSLNILKEIAAQCPLSGGEAVLRARALLRLLNPAIIGNYNDIALCGAVNPRQEKNTSLQGNVWVNLYPNPVSSGMLNLVYQMPDKRDDYRITVVNMLGTQVLDIPLDGQDGAKQMNVEALQNGIYCYMVRTNEKTLLTGKFVVLH
jgi:hypothetical protein